MIYCCGQYQLDTERRELRCGSALVSLEPQVFDVLAFLMQHHERVVTKDDLIAAVWENRTVSDSTLSSRIAAARQAIGDTGEAQAMIRTIARKGFRFVGDIQIADTIDQHSATAPSDTKSSSLNAKPSIAVLPFINLSGDLEQEYFADGVTEDLITALSHFRWLFVIARSSSFTFKGRHSDVKDIGQKLGVRYLLEGSVRRAAARIRITSQLIDTSTGTHIWADRYDGAIEDIFELQDQLTASVVGAIGPKLEQAEIDRAKRKAPGNLDAYDYYLRGVANTVPYTKEGYEEALSQFYRVIEIDPAFAPAYGMASWCYVTRMANGG